MNLDHDCNRSPATGPAPADAPGPPWPGDMRLRLVAPIEATLLTHWRAPCTDGWAVTLTPPLELVVLHPPAEGVSCVYCRPEPLARFQRRHVPWWDRWRPDYGGLSLLVESDALRRATVRDGCVTTVTSTAESRS